jgi:hypothetical protein
VLDLKRPRLRAFHDELAAEIPCFPDEARTDLQAMPLSSLLIHYLNWADRIISSRSRKVLSWSGFSRHSKAKKHPTVLAALQQRMTAGEDLKPYLSDRVEKYGYVRSSLNEEGKRRGIEWGDKDYALNVHEVHHLHLGPKIRRSGYVARTDELLFVQFGRDEAGLLMVGDHRSFDDGTLALAVAELQAESGQTIKGVTGETLSARDHNKLRRRGINSAVAVGEQVVHGGLISSAGTSLFHTTYAQYIMRTLEVQEPLLDDPNRLSELFAHAEQAAPTDARIMWKLNHCDFGLFEERTGVFFEMAYWRR